MSCVCPIVVNPYLAAISLSVGGFFAWCAAAVVRPAFKGKTDDEEDTVEGAVASRDDSARGAGLDGSVGVSPGDVAGVEPLVATTDVVEDGVGGPVPVD